MTIKYVTSNHISTMQTYGILAHPATHSLSPLIHNAAFQELNINAKYTIFDIKPNNLEGFIKRIHNEKIAGLSVSIPHKIEVIQYLDEIDEKAKKIGAVNTLFWKNSKLCGTNTDVDGAMQALEEKTTLKNKKVVLFGAGGAGHAIAYGLTKKKTQLTILDNNLNQSQALACPLHATYGLNVGYKKHYFDIVINATPVGMYPNIDNSILNTKDLHQEQIIFDIVYNPLNTKFIQKAQKVGCKTITGDKMFLYQAVKQFEIWTGKKAPIEIMQKILLEKLK